MSCLLVEISRLKNKGQKYIKQITSAQSGTTNLFCLFLVIVKIITNPTILNIEKLHCCREISANINNMNDVVIKVIVVILVIVVIMVIMINMVTIVNMVFIVVMAVMVVLVIMVLMVVMVIMVTMFYA
jgi:hypothetical protein